MSLVSSKELLLNAKAGGYALGAFNFDNMEMCEAIIEAAEKLCAPAIIQTTPLTMSYGDAQVLSSIAKTLAQRASVPIALHLDHGDKIETVNTAITCGYTSVMIDGSSLSLEDNIALAKKVTDIATPFGIPVEAELGHVGGVEDGISTSGTGCTNPDDAVIFIKETNISSLAVSIGTAHGVYLGTPKLNIERLKEIKARLIKEGIDIPLVLHGASGLSDEAVKCCITNGICKVNFATELRQAFTNGILSVLNNDKKQFDPKIYGKIGREETVKAVEYRIRVCGSNGKAK